MVKDFSSYVHYTHSFEYLSLEKEKLLAMKAKEGCQKSREQIIKSHLRLVFNIAKHFSYNHNNYFEDLVQEGNLGLLYAIDNFDPTKNNRFSLYAKWWIKEFIKRKHYKNIYMLSTPFRIVQKSFHLTSNSYETLQKEKKQGENLAINNMVYQPFYLSDPVGGQSDVTLENAIQDETNDFITDYDTQNHILFIRNLIQNHLNDKEQFVLEERYFNNLKKTPYKDISKKLKVSAETIRNIEKTALQKLRYYLK
jgi:RNA polymerase nonessential primary-like sigma factor